MNIYVENIPLSTSEEEIRHLFTPYGTVESVFLVKDKKTGLPEGAAYVRMASSLEGEHAIAALEGSEYNGQQLHLVEVDDTDGAYPDYW